MQNAVTAQDFEQRSSSIAWLRRLMAFGEYMNDKSCKRTLEYYRTNADRFANDTFNADMSDVRRRFMNYLPHGAFILDFGCYYAV